MDSPGDFMQLCVHAHRNLAFAVWFQFYYTTKLEGVKMAITINVSIDDKEVRKMLELLQKRVGNLRPAMKAIGETVRTSVIKNFMSEGRPDRWEPSRRAKKEGGKTLTDKGRLRNSITAKADSDRVVIGTKVKYAAIHHFGFDDAVIIKDHIRRVKSRDIWGKIDGKRRKLARGVAAVTIHTRKMKIPARPYLMVQDEDWRVINEHIWKHIIPGWGQRT
jgi:phage virion morphogenesis protein